MSEPRLKKRFGQHHLTRPELCRPLLDYLRPNGLRVLEVGPGGGILTRLLVDLSSAVTALELDPEWAFALRRESRPGRPALAVADAMKVRWDRLPVATLVTGNLPYEIASALVRRLLPLHARVPRMAFLVQREVAERFTAKPGTKAYGLLSVLSAAWSDARMIGTVARGSFKPPPKVEGAFVGFDLKPPPLSVGEMKIFSETVETAFSQRRKTLRNALASRWGRETADAALRAAGVGSLVRAEELPLDAFLTLARVRCSDERAVSQSVGT